MEREALLLHPDKKDLKEYLWSGLSLVPRQGDVPKGHLSHHQAPSHRDPTSCHSRQPQCGPLGSGLPLMTSYTPPTKVLVTSQPNDKTALLTAFASSSSSPHPALTKERGEHV